MKKDARFSLMFSSRQWTRLGHFALGSFGSFKPTSVFVRVTPRLYGSPSLSGSELALSLPSARQSAQPSQGQSRLYSNNSLGQSRLYSNNSQSRLYSNNSLGQTRLIARPPALSSQPRKIASDKKVYFSNLGQKVWTRRKG